MNPIPFLAGVIVFLLVALLILSGISLAWGIVVILALAVVALACLCVAVLPRWPG